MGKRIRPCFELRVPLSGQEIQLRVSHRLKDSRCPVSGLVAFERVELHAHAKDQHLWSPQLIVDLEPGATGTLLRAHFGPHPSVWSMYVAAYALCFFVALFGSSVGFAQLVMAETPWALASLPAAGALSAALYLMALMGQGLSIDQMNHLRRFFEEALGQDWDTGKPSL